MLNFGFVIEQWMGHITHQQNLERWVAEDPDIHPTWMPIEVSKNDIWERLPVIRKNVLMRAATTARFSI